MITLLAAHPARSLIVLDDLWEAAHARELLPAIDRNLNALLARKRRLFQDALMPPAATDEDRNELFTATVTSAA